MRLKFPPRGFIAAWLVLLAWHCASNRIDIPRFKAPSVERLLATPALAQSARCQGMVGNDTSLVHNATGCPVPAGNPASASFEAHATPTCVTTTCTGSSITLTTTPLSTDTVAVPFCLRAGTSISAVTYNSSSMSQVSGAYSGNNSMFSDIWYITGSAVTTNPAIIVATTGTTPTRVLISIYDIKTSSSTPTGGSNNFVGSTGPLSATITVNSNGVALADGCQQTPGTGPTMTGGGVTLDDTYLNTNGLLSGHTTTVGSDTISTAAGTGGNANISISLAAWPND